MDKLKIQASMHLSGDIIISGAKNAALPLLCASLLSSDTLQLSNVPNLKDITTLSSLLSSMGVLIDSSKLQSHNLLSLSAKNITNCVASYDLVKTMRASILVLGPLLARFGEAKVSLPGGCAIGARPVDLHIKGLSLMGADIAIEHGYIIAKSKQLHGAKITMDVVTVTGTENLLMAATLAYGTTILENAATEPEVTDLANCLNAMGAQIEGIGTNTLIIHGVQSLHGVEHSIVPDRIEAGTYAVAALMTRGDLTLVNSRPDTMGAVIDKLKHAGAIVNLGNDYIHIKQLNRAKSVDITTAPYPAFPTDMQAQFMALNCISSGSAVVTETIFENRFMHVPELCRMGASIDISNSKIAMVRGVDTLNGTTVMATDLRASASLVLAGLVANGETVVDRIYHLDRGYENIEHKLNSVGANIVRVST